MAQFLSFCPQILGSCLEWRHNDRCALDNSDSRFLECRHLFRIIREEPHLRYFEVLKNGGRQGVVSQISLETELLVCLDRIQAFILKLVRAQFIQQSDTTAFLMFVDEEAAALSHNLIERQLQLCPAVTTQAMKHVTGQALGMNPHQRRA